MNIPPNDYDPVLDEVERAEQEANRIYADIECEVYPMVRDLELGSVNRGALSELLAYALIESDDIDARTTVVLAALDSMRREYRSRWVDLLTDYLASLGDLERGWALQSLRRADG